MVIITKRKNKRCNFRMKEKGNLKIVEKPPAVFNNTLLVTQTQSIRRVISDRLVFVAFRRRIQIMHERNSWEFKFSPVLPIPPLSTHLSSIIHDFTPYCFATKSRHRRLNPVNHRHLRKKKKKKKTFIYQYHHTRKFIYIRLSINSPYISQLVIHLA